MEKKPYQEGDFMHRRSLLLWIATLLLTTLLLSGCSTNGLFSQKPYKETQFLMDTVIDITAYGPGAEEAVKASFAEFQRMHNLTNHFDVNSQVSKINQMAGKEPVAVDPDLLYIIDYSCQLSSKLEGTFDITIGPLVELWGIGRKGDYVPTQAEIDKARSLVDYRRIKIDHTAHTVYLPKEGMLIDLGGIAKGYTVDKVIEILKAKGIKSALVNAGGDVRVIGNKPDGKPWRIGVQDPRQSDGVVAKLSLTSWDTMETSGDYQRFIMKDGIRYSHIIDPRTGWQPRTVTSVTTVNNSSTDGDILGTAIFIVGPEKGLNLLQQFHGNEAVIVTNDGKVVMTSGLEGKIELSSELEKK